MTSQQIDLVFHRCDLDKDGKLNFEEFERWRILNQKINTMKRIVACLRMMKRHMVGTGGLTVEESEKKMQEAETDEEIEEQVTYLAKAKTYKQQ